MWRPNFRPNTIPLHIPSTEPPGLVASGQLEMLYPSAVNWWCGPSGSGKMWLASQELSAVIRQPPHGSSSNAFLWTSTPHDRARALEKLVTLNVPAWDISQRLYIAKWRSLDPSKLAKQIKRCAPSLVVIKWDELGLSLLDRELLPALRRIHATVLIVGGTYLEIQPFDNLAALVAEVDLTYPFSRRNPGRSSLTVKKDLYGWFGRDYVQEVDVTPGEPGSLFIRPLSIHDADG